MKNQYITYGVLLAGAFSLTSCFDDLPNPATGTLSPVVAVKYVRDLYNGDPVALEPGKLMGAHQISGVVISDETSKNLADGHLVLQNKNKNEVRGITVDLGPGGLAQVVPGDSVTVDISGGTLTRQKGTLLITGIQPSDVRKASSNNRIILQQITSGELHANFSKYESTLVQIPNADVVPTPTTGQTFAGEKSIADGSGGQVKITTLSSATFANERIPLSASFVGIPTYFNESRNTNIGALMQLRLRSAGDAQDPTGMKYANFPETFESPAMSTKGSYNMANNEITAKTGKWTLYQAILAGSFNNDRYNPSGAQAIRMQQNLSESGYVQMNFDVPNGASKVTVSYGSYGGDVSSTFRLEYSQDQGQTWTQVGTDVSTASSTPQVAYFAMNIKGAVRFRINKLGLGTSTATPPIIQNGRLSIDDFTIYQSLD